MVGRSSSWKIFLQFQVKCVYELRITYRHQNYRILYGFVGRNVALLTHGLIKERRVPPQDIRLAAERKRAFEADPDGHRYEGE